MDKLIIMKQYEHIYLYNNLYIYLYIYLNNIHSERINEEGY